MDLMDSAFNRMYDTSSSYYLDELNRFGILRFQCQEGVDNCNLRFYKGQ